MAGLKAIDGGLVGARDGTAPCPDCKASGCPGCSWEGTKAAATRTAEWASLKRQIEGIPDPLLSELAVQHALEVLASFRGTKARYAAALLREVAERAGLTDIAG